MLKRIVIIITAVFIIALSIIPIVSANEYIISPDTDGQHLYTIYPSNLMNPLYYYNVYGYNAGSITYINGANPFVRTFFPLFDELSDGTYEYSLYSTSSSIHESVLQLQILSSGTQYTLKYVVSNLQTNVTSSTFLIPLTSIRNDLCIYADNTGMLYMYYFNYYTGDIVDIENYSGRYCPAVFYGDMYPAGYDPDQSTENVIDAYNRGKAEGIEIGQDIGYAEGLADGSLTAEQEQAIFDSGKQEGYEEGKRDGLEQGASLDNEAVYNAGVNKGQLDAKIIPGAISGFFEGITKFFTPFLSIGLGSITLYNLLAIIIIVGICILIVKIIRG